MVFLTDGGPTATSWSYNERGYNGAYYGTEAPQYIDWQYEGVDNQNRSRFSCEPAYEDACDDARALVDPDGNPETDDGYKLYNIFTYGTTGTTGDYQYMIGLTNVAYGEYEYDGVNKTDRNENTESVRKYSTNATSTDKLVKAFQDIFHDVAVQRSYAQVKITDGLRQDAMTFNITDGKPTSAVYTVTPEGSTDPLYTVTASMPVDGGDPVVTFRIYDSTYPEGFYEMPGVRNENIADPDDPLNSYDAGVYYSVTTPSQDGGPDTVYKMALAEIQNGNQLIWDLKPVGDLMDDCTYTAEFIV